MHVISVVIPALNDRAALEQAVESCLSQHPTVVDEIVIAVGPSTDGTRELCLELAQKHPILRVVDNPVGRTPNALNLAIKASRGDILVRVDARSVLPSDYVANALELMTESGAANVGAIQNPVGYVPMQRAIAAAMRSRFGSGGAKYRVAKQPQKVDTAYLGVFKRAALVDVGGFDESFVRNQDAELNERLNRAGYAVWLDPRLVVDYQPRSSLRDLASQYWQYGWWRRITARKHRGSLRLRQVLPPLVVPVIVAAGCIAFWFPPAALIPAGYFAALLIAAAAARDVSLVERGLMALALVTMHTGWAGGFIASSLRFRADSRRR